MRLKLRITVYRFRRIVDIVKPYIENYTRSYNVYALILYNWLLLSTFDKKTRKEGISFANIELEGYSV